MRALIVSLLVLSMTVPVAAQDPPALVPKLELTDCAPEQKCLDLENYRRYLLMRNHYTALFDQSLQVPELVLELKKAAEVYEEAEKVTSARAIRAEDAYDKLFPKYVDAVQREEKAKRLSLLGGGLPWLITAALVGAAAGGAIGVWLVTPRGSAADL